MHVLCYKTNPGSASRRRGADGGCAGRHDPGTDLGALVLGALALLAIGGASLLVARRRAA